MPIANLSDRSCAVGDGEIRRHGIINTRWRGVRTPTASIRSAFVLLVLILVLPVTTVAMAAQLPVVNEVENLAPPTVDTSLSAEQQSASISSTPTTPKASWSAADRSRLTPAYRKHLPTKLSDRKSNSNFADMPPSPYFAEVVDNIPTTLGLSEEVDEVDDETFSTTVSTEPTTVAVVGRARKLPEAIIIGVKKGGTRALLEFLKIHPDIRAPGPEIHYFDRYYDKGLDWYRSRMPPTLPGQLTIEKTPSYFVTRSAPQRVFRSMPRDVRLIVVVRDPVTRALSDYTQGLVKRPDLLPFERMAFSAPSTTPGINASSLSSMSSVNISWGAIRIGLYARHLERWLRWFPLDRFHFVSGERLVEDPAGEIGRLEDFLGVQRVVTTDHFYFNVTKGFPCLKKSEARAAPRCLGQAKGRAHPVVDPLAIERLRRFFRPFNRKFYEMTGVDFGWQ